MKSLFGNSCAKGCLVYFVALIAIVAVTSMGLGGLKGRFAADSQQPQGSILTTSDNGSTTSNPPSDVVGGGTLPTMEPLPQAPPTQVPVVAQPTLVAPVGPTVPAGPVLFTPVPSQGGIISGETVPPFYIVQSGDTLWDIATRFGVSIDMLRALNKIDGSIIQPGQILYLPQSNQSQVIPQPQATAVPTSSSGTQPLPQTGLDTPTVVIPNMPHTGIPRDGTP